MASDFSWVEQAVAAAEAADMVDPAAYGIVGWMHTLNVGQPQQVVEEGDQDDSVMSEDVIDPAMGKYGWSERALSDFQQIQAGPANWADVGEDTAEMYRQGAKLLAQGKLLPPGYEGADGCTHDGQTSETKDDDIEKQAQIEKDDVTSVTTTQPDSLDDGNKVVLDDIDDVHDEVGGVVGELGVRK